MRAAVLAACADAQADVAVAAGDRFIRGGRLVFVVSVDGDRVTVRDGAADEERQMLLDEFRSRALVRVEVELGADLDPVEIAWGIARQAELSPTDRAQILVTLLTGDQAIDQVINGWVADLVAGREPRRGER